MIIFAHNPANCPGAMRDLKIKERLLYGENRDLKYPVEQAVDVRYCAGAPP
jgi:hypothetical protein